MQLTDVVILLSLVVVWYRFLRSTYVARVDSWLRRLISRKIIREITKPDRRFTPVPCVFANGEDDDWPGLEAIFTNKAVIIGDVYFGPGDPINVKFDKLWISPMGVRVRNQLTGELVMRTAFKPYTELTMPSPGRAVMFEVRQFYSNHKVKTYQ